MKKKKINLKDKNVQAVLALIVVFGLLIIFFFNPTHIIPYALIAYLALRFWQESIDKREPLIKSPFDKLVERKKK